MDTEVLVGGTLNESGTLVCDVCGRLLIVEPKDVLDGAEGAVEDVDGTGPVAPIVKEGREKPAAAHSSSYSGGRSMLRDISHIGHEQHVRDSVC